MANITTYDLIQCSDLYPTIDGAENIGLAGYVDDYVQFDGDPEQSYQVRKNVQARFLHPTTPAVGQSTTFSVTSLKVNGLESLSAPSNITFTYADLIHVEFPNYALAPNGYTAGVANAVYTEDVGVSVGIPPRNFTDFLQGVFTAIGSHIKIRLSNDEWWIADGFPSLINFLIETYSNESVDITIEQTLTSPSSTIEYRYVFDWATSTVEYYEDGVLWVAPPQVTTEMPQMGDEYSIYQDVFTYSSVVQINSCPILSLFTTSLFTDNCSNLNVDCDCTRIQFSDNSLYNNGLVGHASSLFNFRKIIITKPNGQYIYTTDITDLDADEYIQPHYNSTNIFNYAFTSSDVDGIYEIMIYTYPDWDASVYYDSLLQNRVLYNGVFYKQVLSSIGQDPELDVTNTYWIAMTESEVMDITTRYCTTSKIVVVCLSILRCYKNAIKNAFCGIEANPCGSVCDNVNFQRAMKMRITLDMMAFAASAGDWNSVESHMEILNSLCCCNG